MKYLRYLGYGCMIVLFTSGCVRRVRYIPVEPVVDENTSRPTSKPAGRPARTLYDTTRTEHKYKLKPEPYSAGSKEKDPELLGPERTVKEPDQPMQAMASQPAETPASAPKLQTSMSKRECISMIGQTKFERYSKRFGGEAGALKRCAILKKLKRS